jgi:uncharacterized membrane protein YfcA
MGIRGLGLLAGTLSGLFGIGGGMVIVPGLLYVFQVMDLPSVSVMHLAGGTSMAIMIFTSLASVGGLTIDGGMCSGHWCGGFCPRSRSGC